MTIQQEVLDIIMQIRASGLPEADAVNAILAKTGTEAQAASVQVQGLTQAHKEHASQLQTMNAFLDQNGQALSRQEQRYAELQLGSKEFAVAERDLTEEANAAARAMGAMGEDGLRAFDRLTALGGVMGSAGPLGIGIGAAIIGVGVLAETVKGGVEAYTRLAEEVLQYQRVTGQSAEASSRQVEAFKVLGVQSDVATNAMFRLEKSIEETPKKFEQLGITIDRNADGNLDLAKTLGDLSDKYNATADAATKSAIVFTAFGRSGADMIPVLEQGSAGLSQLEQQAARVFSQEDLERVHKYEIEQKQAAQSIDQMKMTIGSGLLPIVKSLTDSFNENVFVNEKLDAAMKNHNKTVELSRTGQAALAASFRQQYQDGLDAKEGLDNLAAGQKAAAAAAREADAAMESEITTTDKFIGGNIAMQRSDQGVIDQLDNLKLKQDAYTLAIDKYGPASDQAQAANKALQRTHLDVLDAMVKDAQQAVTYAGLQAALGGHTLTAADNLKIERDKLSELERALDPNSPLRQQLDAYIAQLNRIPKTESTQIIAEWTQQGYVPSPTGPILTSGDFSVGAIPAFAAGGLVTKPTVALVGESGPELIVPMTGAGEMNLSAPQIGKPFMDPSMFSPGYEYAGAGNWWESPISPVTNQAISAPSAHTQTTAQPADTTATGTTKLVDGLTQLIQIANDQLVALQQIAGEIGQIAGEIGIPGGMAAAYHAG